MPARRSSPTLPAIEIYRARQPLTTHHFNDDAFAPIDGCSLATYAAVCRALVRVPRGTPDQLEAALAAHGIAGAGWGRIRQGWSARIARDPFVRAAFRRLYVGDGEPAAD